jgi:DNA-binding SARP family transcriptional activator/TolB-like protein/cytochrome c-type biogenesis protein CcmH/NrfG
VNVATRIRAGAGTHRTILGCLGSFRIYDQSGNQFQVRTRKARALLAALAISGRPMSRDSLAALLWSDRGEPQARASLRQSIFELQHCFGQEPVLVATRDDLSVRNDILATDLDLLREAAAGKDWKQLLVQLRHSESGLLSDLDGLDEEFDSWLRAERSIEPAATLSCSIEAAEQCLESAGPRAALEIVAEVLRLDSVNEAAARLAMRIDWQLGDSAALHRHYSALRQALLDDYGVEPSAETADLFARLAGGPAPGPAAGPEAGRAPAKARLARRRALPIALVAMLAAFIAAAILLLPRGGSGSAAADSSVLVAVLPFEQQPPDGSFLAAGLWEQTRGALARNPSIRVLGRATTEAMTGGKSPPSDYRKRLGVTHLLEGTVRRSGADLLVSVSLTRTSDGVAVWQDSFRGKMGEAFALQDAIANGIEGKLRAQLAPDGGRRAEQIATSPEVYALYSEARNLISRREQAGSRRAEWLLRRALRMDPNYAPAWSLLGAAIIFNERVAIADSRARSEGLAAARHALSLAPNFAPAHATLALIEGTTSREAEAPLRTAVKLDPSDSEAWSWLGNSLVAQGRYGEGIAAYEKAVAIDPLFYPAVMNLFTTADEVHDRAAIAGLLRTVRRAGPSTELLLNLQVEQAYQHGDFSSAIELLRARGLDSSGKPRPLLWNAWFQNLTAIGAYDALHRVTGCPDWYSKLLTGKQLPPTIFQGKAVAPGEFWTSEFFSAAASRAMIQLGHERDLVALYRAAYRNADEFMSMTGRRDLLPELAANLGIALKASGSSEEAAYILASAASRLEDIERNGGDRWTFARLALVRAAQGEGSEALEELDLALRKGWFPDGRSVGIDIGREPAFAALRGEPRFEAMRDRIVRHVAREQAELGPLDA